MPFHGEFMAQYFRKNGVIYGMTKQGKIVYGGLRALDRELRKEEWRDARYTIIVDENTFQHCLPLLIGTVEALQEAEFVEVPVGEECKSIEVAAQVWQTLMEGGADRQSVIVNLGGGAVCDLGGFVAAGYKRGIRHINVATWVDLSPQATSAAYVTSMCRPRCWPWSTPLSVARRQLTSAV